MSEESGWGKVWSGAKAVGRASKTAGRWVGARAVDGYNAIDPDLRRHFAELPLLALTTMDARKVTIEAQPYDGHRPIIFVHGLGGHRGNFVPMATYFRVNGRRRMVRADVPTSGSISERAQALADLIGEVARIFELQSDDRVDLVCHSMGGLVARAALDLELPVQVATLVTMGTPHHGTQLARYGGSDITRELRPDSATLAKLNGQLPWPGPPERPRMLALWSAGDVILLPHGTATVEGATNLEMEGVTHYGYLLRPACWRAVFDALEEPS